MGAPMARHLAAAGHELSVWSHNAGKAKSFASAERARHCSTPAQVAESSEYIFLCVGDTAMSKEVILGEDGLIQKAAPGVLIADCSTISPLESVAIAESLKKKQVDFLDAPCTGSKAGAEGGTLTFMIGGERAAFDRARPYFESMGKSLYYCGLQGMGLRAKLTQNLILGNLLQAFNEGFVLSTKAGVDPGLMLDIVSNSAARSGFISAKARAVFRRDCSTNCSVRWLEKDLQLMLDLGRELEVPLPHTALSQQSLRNAIAKGYGDDDICGSIRVLEELAGVEVSQPVTAAAK